MSPRGESWPPLRTGSPNRSAREIEGCAISGVGARTPSRPHAATAKASPKAAMAPAQNLVALVPTPKPYKAVIHRPTHMADRKFTFTAGMGRGLLHTPFLPQIG